MVDEKGIRERVEKIDKLQKDSARARDAERRRQRSYKRADYELIMLEHILLTFTSSLILHPNDCNIIFIVVFVYNINIVIMLPTCCPSH